MAHEEQEEALLNKPLWQKTGFPSLHTTAQAQVLGLVQHVCNPAVPSTAQLGAAAGAWQGTVPAARPGLCEERGACPQAGSPTPGREAGLLRDSILPGLVQLRGSPCGRGRLRLHCAAGQGLNPAAAELLPGPAKRMVAVPQARGEQAGCGALGMALLPCCFLPTGSEGGCSSWADPLPSPGPGLVPGGSIATSL